MLVFLSVPIAQRGDDLEFVQCGFCRRVFHPSVLDLDPPMIDGRNAEAAGTSDTHFSKLKGAAASTLLTWTEDDATTTE